MFGFDEADAPSPLRLQLDRARDHFAGTVDPRASLEARAQVMQFLAEHHDELLQTAGVSRVPPPAVGGLIECLDDLPVYTFWNTPITAAPPLVQACVGALKRLHPEAIVLDSTTVASHISLSPEVVARIGDHAAHYSDFLRLSLLERFGGIWVDATCMALSPLTDGLRARLDGAPECGMLMPRWTEREVSNWFIAARRGHPLIALERAALELWWRVLGTLPDYFLFHRIFAGLLREFPSAGRLWADTPWFGSAPAHLLQLSMYQPYDPALVSASARGSFVQKLSYKYDQDAVPTGSVLERIISGQPLMPR